MVVVYMGIVFLPFIFNRSVHNFYFIFSLVYHGVSIIPNIGLTHYFLIGDRKSPKTELIYIYVKKHISSNLVVQKTLKNMKFYLQDLGQRPRHNFQSRIGA